MNIQSLAFNILQVNTYILWDETKECAIIDAACQTEKEKLQLKEFITKKGLTPKVLLNTHLHFDHVLGSAFVYNQWELSPQANRNDEPLYSRLTEQLSALKISINIERIPIGTYLEDGDTIYFGNSSLKVLHIGGHSPGCICFYNEKEKVLFSGDVLFLNCIGRTDFLGGSHQQLIRGIQEKILPLPDETIVYPGHGDPTSIENEKIYNPYI